MIKEKYKQAKVTWKVAGFFHVFLLICYFIVHDTLNITYKEEMNSFRNRTKGLGAIYTHTTKICFKNQKQRIQKASNKGHDNLKN